MSLSSIRSRVEAATPGPWAQSGNAARPHWYVSNPEVLVHGFGMVREPDTVKATVERWTADAAFIAHARQDIPAMLRVAEAAADWLHEEDSFSPYDDSDAHAAVRAIEVAKEALRAALAELEALP